ncbi:MAG: hypothetical protein M3P99_09035, partial [Pseudomonadota bacterium]|nr:hypothetical protein [Pseudomonadota bacterium]
LLAYLVLGLVAGWLFLALRDDIRIKTANKWRRVRAFLMTGLCIVFATALFFVNALGLLFFISGYLVMPALYAVRKK